LETEDTRRPFLWPLLHSCTEGNYLHRRRVQGRAERPEDGASGPWGGETDGEGRSNEKTLLVLQIGKVTSGTAAEKVRDGI
jgi:hypothetical protein